MMSAMRALIVTALLASCAQEIVIDDRDALVPTDVGPRDAGPGPTMSWHIYDVMLSDRLRAVHGTASDDVWAVGERGVVLHFDGRTWTRVNVGLLDELYDVFAVSRDDVWVVGENSAIAHLVDRVWTPVRGVVPSGTRLIGVTANGPSDVWVLPEGPIDVGATVSEHAAVHFDGMRWSTIARPDPGSYEKSMILLSSSGVIVHDSDLQLRAGNDWINIDPPVRESGLGFEDAAFDAQGRVWLLASEISPSRARVFRFQTGSWSELDGPGLVGGLFSTDLVSIQADGEQAWAVGEMAQLSHFDGQSWQVAIPQTIAGPKLLSVFLADGRVFAVGARGAVVCAGCP